MEIVGLDYLRTKIKTKQDIVDFFREIGKLNYLTSGYYYPNSPGFDSKFFYQVLSGAKSVRNNNIIFQLLPLGALGGYKFNYFTRSNSATKNHILQLFKDEPALMKYVPDDIKITSLNRELLLSVRYIYNFRYYITPIKTNF